MPALKTIDEVLALASGSLKDLIFPRFVSVLLYHIVPQPEQTLEDLAAESPVDTAFIHSGEAFTLKFSADGKTVSPKAPPRAAAAQQRGRTMGVQ